jgi:hypothetical protein
MRVSCTYGSVRGAAGDRRPYRDAFGASERQLRIRAAPFFKTIECCWGEAWRRSFRRRNMTIHS